MTYATSNLEIIAYHSEEILKKSQYVVARRAFALSDEATSSFIEKIASGEDQKRPRNDIMKPAENTQVIFRIP
jgi:hypothetical protein